MRIKLKDSVEHVRESLATDVKHPVADDGAEVAAFATKDFLAGKLALTASHYRLAKDGVYEVADDMGQELIDTDLAAKVK